MSRKAAYLKPGDVVAGRFRIVEAIGSGGFSVVYRAHQEGMNRFVALKVLKPDVSHDIEIVERFRREALYASHLSHPNTITLYDYGQSDDGEFYIAMEYLVGKDLAEDVQHGRPLDPKRIWKILVQCARSLGEAHRLGLVHRDLKPENIFLVERDGRELVKVLDFGVSKTVGAFKKAGPRTLAPLTQEGTVFGTPLYMAPEQAMAEDISPALDVYALGHIAYEMLTGRAAYADLDNPMDVMLHQINDPPLELPGALADTPFAALVRRCTQKDPAHRFGDAPQLLNALMDAAFAPYMDVEELREAIPQRSHAVTTAFHAETGLPPAAVASIPSIPVVPIPSAQPSSLARIDQQDEGYQWSTPNVAETYKAEFEALSRALAEVLHTGQVRLVVLRGKAATGRSNLLRTFLAGVELTGNARVIHRQTNKALQTEVAGLEADVAQAMGLPLEGQGLGELKRLLRLVHGEEDILMQGEPADFAVDSSPLSRLTSMRDSFLSRISYPFLKLAESSPIVWGIEALERVDNLTLAFIDRFYRELQSHPAPVLLVVTVFPDEISHRPGLMRYTHNVLQASAPFGRQLMLVPPSERGSAPAPARQPTSAVGSLQAGGTYIPGLVPYASASETLPPVPFQLMPHQGSESHEVFDDVLGCLAQLGNDVPEPLWKKMCEELLAPNLAEVAEFVVQGAERFGILERREDHIAFVSSAYAETMREQFEQDAQAIAAHAKIGDLLQKYFKPPTREQLQLIVQHYVLGGKQRRAARMLLEAAEDAYAAMDLDASREHYMQIQALIDNKLYASRAGRRQEVPPQTLQLEHAGIWLRLGEIHGALGEHGAAEDALKRALQDANPKAHRIRGAAMKLLGDVACAQKRYAVAMRHYDGAREIFSDAGLARPYVSSITEIGFCALMLGRMPQSEGLLFKALDKAQRLSDRPTIARVHRYLGKYHMRLARFGEAIDHLQRSLANFESMQREAEVMEGLEELGMAHYAAGQFEACQTHFTRAVTMALTGGPLLLSPSPHLGLAQALAAVNNLGQAEAHLADALAVVHPQGDPIPVGEVYLFVGDLYMAQGRHMEALDNYRQVVLSAEAVGQTHLVYTAMVRQGYVYYDADREEDAYKRLIQAREYAESVGNTDQAASARAHVIYLQLLSHDFRTQSDTFAPLVQACVEHHLHQTAALCELFRIDVAMARGELLQAQELVHSTRAKCAVAGDHAMFIPIARRAFMVERALGQRPDPQLGAGHPLGAAIPPEWGKRRLTRLVLL